MKTKLLQRWMKKQGLRPVDLAAKLGASESTIRGWLKGDRKPQPLMIEKLASLMPYSVKQLR